MAAFGAKGLAWFKVEADGTLASPIAKNFTPELLQRIRRSGWTPRRATCCCSWPTSSRSPARRSTPCGRSSAAELKLYDPTTMHFSWIVEFPMFAYDDEEKRWAAMHHPFTAPRAQDFATAGNRPRQVPRPGLRPGDQRLARPAAARSVSTTSASAAGVFAAGHRRANGRRAVRLPAATPCNTAPRRTAASPWASTAG